MRREYHEIEYFRRKAGHEVDFIVTDNDGRKRLIQVAAAMSDNSTRKREIIALTEAMQECYTSHASIIFGQKFMRGS